MNQEEEARSFPSERAAEVTAQSRDEASLIEYRQAGGEWHATSPDVPGWGLHCVKLPDAQSLAVSEIQRKTGREPREKICPPGDA